MPALAYKPQSRTADPSAWGELSSADQDAVLEYLSRGTPGEGTHYATTPTEISEFQALEDAAAEAREAAPLADLVAGSGAAAQGAKFLPTLAELAPWQIATGGLATFGIGFLIGDTVNRYWLHIGGRGLDNPVPAGSWAVSGYHVFWQPGGPMYEAPAPQDLPAGVYLYHDGNWSYSEAFSDDNPPPRNAPPAPLEGDRYPWVETHGNWDVNGNYLSSSHEYFVRLEPGDPGTTIDQPPRPATPSDDGRVIPWSPPADPASDLADAYKSGPLHGFRKWVCHVLGHGCADPFRSYTVPQCLPTDTYSDCVQRLNDEGLTVHHSRTVIDAHAHLEQAPGTVLKTEPAAGTDVRDDTDVEVALNPDPLPDPADLSSDEHCEEGSPSYGGPVSANDGHAFDIITPPTVSSSTFSTQRGDTNLRRGTVSDPDSEGGYPGWGLAHIIAGHGWASGDDRRTRVAFASGQYERNQRPNIDGWIVIGPTYPGDGGVQCQRLVVVEYGTRSGEPAPKGIITSYGRSLIG